MQGANSSSGDCKALQHSSPATSGSPKLTVNKPAWPRQALRKVEAYFLQLFGWELDDYSN
jgi:hypothetical protein